MSEKAIQLRLGVGALIASALLYFVAIPNWVTAPANISNIVLSPVFWPSVLAGLTALVGAGLIAAGLRADDEPVLPGGDVPRVADTETPEGAWLRLAGVAVIMVVILYAMPRIGMVWACMIGFVATAFLVRTHHPLAAIIAAVVVPLLLYFFFAHVAGVAIPQGNFVRLP